MCVRVRKTGKELSKPPEKENPSWFLQRVKIRSQNVTPSYCIESEDCLFEERLGGNHF